MQSAKESNRILFLSPYPFDTAPGQRFRYEQYFDVLTKAGMKWDRYAFLDERSNRVLYKRKKTIRKILGVVSGFLKRPFHLIRSMSYDYVFVFRELTPIGPPIYEWILAKVLRKRIIYDFDDAIWISNTSEFDSWIAGLKWNSKVASICRWSYKVSCGNQYLCDYARAYNKNVVCNPTTIDTENRHDRVKEQNTDRIVIGWTGTHSTLKYLELILPVLEQLASEYDRLEFVVIANKEPDFVLPRLRFIPWNKESEIEDLLTINIGVMPLTDDKWSEGKCGFKALQYMSLGVPAVVSPVGVNKEIVDQGSSGFLCATDKEWTDALRMLIQSDELRREMGRAGRRKVIYKYSVASNTDNFLSLFE